jgi:hypothetical protein
MNKIRERTIGMGIERTRGTKREGDEGADRTG